MHGVAVELRGEVHRLKSKLHDPTHSTADGHGPHAIVASPPVGGDDRRGLEVPALLHVVVDKPLKQELVHRRLIDLARGIEIGLPGYGPVVVGMFTTFWVRSSGPMLKFQFSWTGT